MTDSLKKRIEAHKASVVLNNGQLETKEELINISKGFKVNKLISIVPVQEETVSQFSKVSHLFEDLSHMNLLLTNACNLNCTYCYEQHRKDYGRFTKESLKSAYDWLNSINDKKNKTFQFFGGEPLIHKQLIKEFIQEYDAELNDHYSNYSGTYISMCSNGLLMDDEFAELYFSKPYTHMMLSLDTFDSAVDHRQITPEQMESIIKLIPKVASLLGNEPQRLVIRTTLSEETSHSIGEFIDRLYSMGVRSFIVHPLVLDSQRGYIKWSDENWNTLREQIFDRLHKYPDVIMKFSEGVGQKQDNNCMVGSDMIAIDASGDFSGCYFFTNMKGVPGVGDTVLGNIFKDKVYVDRYHKFQSEYNKMFVMEEKCRSCDLQNYCYQCPAGNLDTGSKKMFRPDDMCQEIVKLYLDFQRDVYHKMFWRNVNEIHLPRLEQDGFDYISKVLTDFGLDPAIPVKDTYELLATQRRMPIDNLPDVENDVVICFYLQSIIILLQS